MIALPTPQDRFSAFICSFASIVWSLGAGYSGGALDHATVMLILNRVLPIAHRLRAIAERLALGPMRPSPPRRPRDPSAAPHPRPPALRWPLRLRGSHAWLVRIAQITAPLGTQLDAILRDPAMQSLIAAAPQLRRILRPLCRMLGTTTLKPPPAPPTPARPKPRPSRPNPPEPAPSGLVRRHPPRPGVVPRRIAKTA